MNFPDDVKYTREHEWARQEGTEVTVGITDYAQEELGDIVFIELPQIGVNVTPGETFGIVESVKAVSDLYSPVKGKVVRINDGLLDAPEKVNNDPYGEGWMIVVELADGKGQEGLLAASDYEAYDKEEKAG